MKSPLMIPFQIKMVHTWFVFKCYKWSQLFSFYENHLQFLNHMNFLWIWGKEGGSPKWNSACFRRMALPWNSGRAIEINPSWFTQIVLQECSLQLEDAVRCNNFNYIAIPLNLLHPGANEMHLVNETIVGSGQKYHYAEQRENRSAI